MKKRELVYSLRAIEYKLKKCRELSDEDLARFVEGVRNLRHKIEESGKTGNRTLAAAKAREAKTLEAKKAIEKGLAQLRKEGAEVTAYKLAKASGVHYRTAQKYLAGMI